MLIVLFAIGLLLIGIGVFLYLKSYNDSISYLSVKPAVWTLNIIGTVICFITLIAALCVATQCVAAINIDNRIEIYATENAAIDQEISEIVSSYTEHETKTFKNVKDKDAVSMVTMFPELKSDELVKEQIVTYRANKREIKMLKCKKLDYRVYAWWLYFGSQTVK